MTINMEKPYVVGMDIGGTNTVFGVVDSRGNVLATDSVKTQQYEKIEEYVDAVCKKLLPLVQQSQVLLQPVRLLCPKAYR